MFIGNSFKSNVMLRLDVIVLLTSVLFSPIIQTTALSTSRLLWEIKSFMLAHYSQISSNELTINLIAELIIECFFTVKLAKSIQLNEESTSVVFT
jgi:hypothetical protein